MKANSKKVRRYKYQQAELTRKKAEEERRASMTQEERDAEDAEKREEMKRIAKHTAFVASIASEFGGNGYGF